MAEVRLTDGRSLNREMVARGMAWHYRQYAPDDAALAEAEADARKDGVGLWSQANPVPPWDWRKQARDARAPKATSAVGPVVGNVRSHAYHAPGCPECGEDEAREQGVVGVGSRGGAEGVQEGGGLFIMDAADLAESSLSSPEGRPFGPLPSMIREPCGKRVIACNIAVPLPECPQGALAYVLQIGHKRARLLARSHGGRWVKIWMAVDRLANFRFKMLDPENPLYAWKDIAGTYDDDDLSSLISAGVGQGLELRSSGQR